MANMLLVVAAAIMMVVNGVAAETYTVGDDSGWTVPSTPDLYTDWAADKNFAVDDVLVFPFSAPHNVAEVSKDAYDQCDAGDAEVFRLGPKEITLTENGPHYFICTFASHCTGGQKLVVTVGAPTTSAPSPTSSSTPSGPSMAPSLSPSSPPPPSDTPATGSSPPMSISTFFSVSFIASVMAFLF
ncbi:hypothetical protein SOVF_075030 [Spinacia oleracea]|uniref:Cucumber peeling cupredoxin-like n=1 Tax=Spinacia oleracea TaxID=3562 RepID=A0A9R0K441_SPIOL|nr:cucumber peeling cupredoxin-like [Spinacia oleracea]KNA17972.1 hypothetical protein SOVF_075030 [Spinacia oleracea]